MTATTERTDDTPARLAPDRRPRAPGYDGGSSEAAVHYVPRWRRMIPLGAVLLAMALGTAAPVGRAAESTAPANRLERPISDVAILDVHDPEATPMLLVLDAATTTDGTTSVAILRRGDAWEAVAEVDIQLEEHGLDARWLIGLGGGRFALVARTPETRAGPSRSVVVGLAVSTAPDQPSIEETGRQTFDASIDDAGAADIDADGTNELVVGLGPGDRTVLQCESSELLVMDPVTLGLLAAHRVPDRRLGGGVVGRWDDVPGDDVLVYSAQACPGRPPTEDDLLTIRLVDGVTVAVASTGTSDANSWFGAPLRMDLDGVAPDEAVARTPEGLAILDPSTGWSTTPLGSDLALPLVAGPDADGPAVRVAWLESTRRGWLTTERIRRDPDGTVALSERSQLDAAQVDGARWAMTSTSAVIASQHLAPSGAWLGDAVDEGCPDLVLPMAILPCGSTDLRPGATWLATRPVAAMQIDGQRSLVIAAGLGWEPGIGLPPTPQPWASGPPGWWRHGPSTPFALSEVRARDVVYFRDFPVPLATIEATTAEDASTSLAGFTGTRMFVTIAPLGDGEEGPDVAPSARQALTTPSGRQGVARVVRVAVPPGNESGRDGSYARLPLGDVGRAGREATSRWALRVVAINDWGEVGFPVVRTITRDTAAPFLSVDLPFTSPIWPVAAHLAGAVEPGSVVVVEGIGEVAVDRRGRFAIEATLAPWPQVFRVTGTDVSGNATVREVSVIGGVDYRQFPWPLIVALTLLLIVAARGLSGSGRDRGSEAAGSSRRAGFGPDEQPIPEIEELPPGAGLARR